MKHIIRHCPVLCTVQNSVLSYFIVPQSVDFHQHIVKFQEHPSLQTYKIPVQI